MHPAIAPTLLLIATLLYGTHAFWKVWHLRHRRQEPPPRTLALIFFVALLAHTAFLSLRGRALQHCPLTTLPEALAFGSWCLGVVYVVIGPLYHLSLLGIFTSPLLALLTALALLLPASDLVAPLPSEGFLFELHAAISVLSYAALGTACIAGINFLGQDYLLKSKRHLGWISFLSPLNDLGRVLRHLLVLGWGFLTISLATSLWLERNNDPVRLGFFVLIWGTYAWLAFLGISGKIGGRRLAWAVLTGFLILTGSFWGVRHLVEGFQYLAK